MATPTLKSLSYRKFDDLVNEVYIDFPSLTREGLVEPGQLIKVAQRCNFELGLKLNKTKETMLEVEHGRAKLPSDFYILNLALLCSHYQICEDGLFNGIHSENIVTPVQNPLTLPQLTSCPCWKVENPTSNQIVTKYVDCTGNNQSLTLPANSTTNICGSIVSNPNMQLIITTDSFCYNLPNSGTFSCTVDGCGCIDPNLNECAVVNADPWQQNKVFTTCNGTMQVNVIEYHSNEIRRYSEFEKIHMRPSKEATAFCVNTQFQDARHHGHIRDGFLWVPTLQHHEYHQAQRKMYICYLGALEDDNGNLLVLDHPLVNNFYEYALKVRIFENMYLNGEPDIERRLQMLQKEYKEARALALTLTTTPDWYEFQKTIEMNRKAMYAKYLHPFSSLYANTPGWPWSYNSDHI